MFARASPLFLLALPWLTAAATCNTGDVQCCNSVQDANDSTVLAIMQLLSITAPLTGQVGFNCSPITVIGDGSGASCKQQTVCCTDNKFNGMITVGCSPVDTD